MNKILLKTIVLAISITFVALALASALPSSHTVTTSKDVSNAITHPNSSVNSHIQNKGYVKSTLFLVNNTLLSGNANSNGNGVGLQSVTYDPLNKELYAAALNTLGSGSNSPIYVLNGTTGKVIDILQAGMATQSFTFDPANGHIYVINRDSDNVSVINGSTNQVTGSINVGFYPMYSAYDPSNGNLYVSNSFNNNVSIINTSTDTVIGSLSVGSEPNGLAYDSANGYIYVTDSGGSNITVINGSTNKVIDSITVGQYPSEAAYDPGNGYIYVTNAGDSTISVIDGSNDTVIGQITVGSGPYAIAFDSSNGYVYVTNANSNDVSVVDVNSSTVISTIPVGNDPESVAIGGPGGYIYVSNLNTGNFGGISIINSTTNTLFKTVYTIAAPTSLTLNPLNGNLYTANYYPNDVSVVNTTTNSVNGTINVGYSPIATAFDPQNGNVYILNNNLNSGSNNGNITIINGSTGNTIGSIPVSNPPQGMAFDPSNGYIYVTANLYPESYLYTINASSGAIISQSSYYSPNGSYGSPIYNPLNSNIYVYNSTSYQFLIINSSTNSVVSTTTQYGYPYPSSGIFDPFNGYLYLTTQYGEEVINATTNVIVTFVNVGSNPVSSAFDPSNGYVYVANEYSNNISVINGATNTIVGNITVGNEPDAVAYSPSSGDIYVANYASGTVSVIPTAFYNVTFTETGLPSESTWYVNLTNGQSYTSVGPTLSFSEPNGTYTYTVSTSDNAYEPPQTPGSFTVNGTNVSSSVSFSEVLYTVKVAESGLPVGTTWYVNLSNGQDFASQTSNVKFSESNGTYSYTVSTSNKTYEASPHTSSFSVNGANVSVSSTFKKVEYQVTFTESGLTAGTTWYVNLSNGESFSSTNSTMEFMLENGTYPYTVNTTMGYAASHSNGTLSVNGGNITETVNFTSSPAKSSSGIPGPELYGIIGGVVIVGIVGTAVFWLRKYK